MPTANFQFFNMKKKNVKECHWLTGLNYIKKKKKKKKNQKKKIIIIIKIKIKTKTKNNNYKHEYIVY